MWDEGELVGVEVDGTDGSGSPISSKASRRAVCKGVSVKVSDLPPGRAAWPASVGRMSALRKVNGKSGRMAYMTLTCPNAL